MVKNSREFYTTAELARILGISRVAVFKRIQNGSIPAQKMGRNFVIFKKNLGGLEVFVSPLFKEAKGWAIGGKAIAEQWYCPHADVFQARLSTMQTLMLKDRRSSLLVPLLTSIAGEIGNNSYDHNIGQWPDVSGIFFGYDLARKQIVLADRGVGILATLRRVKPELINHQEALTVAFTEILSSRRPEARGNGLKYVRSVVVAHPITLTFQSGNAKLALGENQQELSIEKTPETIRGCIALITY